MTKIQKLVCPECKAEFEFNPNSVVITSLNKSISVRTKKEAVVTAYLECPNGHTKPYKVIKEY
jgi:hypothetical protein